MYVQLPEKLESSLRDSPVISCVLDNWTELALPNCWMVAGAVFQTFWTRVHGYSSLYGIDDIDLVYFDPYDLKVARWQPKWPRIEYRRWEDP
jgi:hypothetical protein